MSDTVSRMETMLFNYQTTNRTDFRDGEILPPTFTTYKEKPGCLRIRPPPLKDHHTLSAWRTKGVPFSLMHVKKPITRTDPTKVQQPCSKPPDEEIEEAIRTRPRLVMTPAVSMDDVTDKRARQILIDAMYTSTMTSGTREAISDYFTVRAPLPGRPAPANPIKLPPLTLPYVSPEWRMQTVPWDRNQLRSYCDSTKEFWLAQKLPPCHACRETEIVEADRKMRHQMQKARR
ncbi:hypothetical protein PYW08_001265 [Mythimna loreyi]|uniref:Uncharacterized protein n=1 Tax=Mythimna loreyi TaxID=667449 RepID=A0ACC2R2A3_9NEOP|nr:hypothetical protein PYW08_001265 [Mythimna loreyi]